MCIFFFSLSLHQTVRNLWVRLKYEGITLLYFSKYLCIQWYLTLHLCSKFTCIQECRYNIQPHPGSFGYQCVLYVLDINGKWTIEHATWQQRKYSWLIMKSHIIFFYSDPGRLLLTTIITIPFLRWIVFLSPDVNFWVHSSRFPFVIAVNSFCSNM